MHAIKANQQQKYWTSHRTNVEVHCLHHSRWNEEIPCATGHLFAQYEGEFSER